VAPPAGLTRTLASYHQSLADPGHGEFEERFEGPDGRELRVTQTVPAGRPSEGNPWVEIAPGFRVQVAGTSPGSASAAVFWSERGRRFSVYVSDSRADDLHGVVAALHEQVGAARGVRR
jgi:hypothetical protein